MTLDTYEFSSCFAPYIEGLIQRKHEEGFLFNSARHILISFDRFCIRKGYQIKLSRICGHISQGSMLRGVRTSRCSTR